LENSIGDVSKGFFFQDFKAIGEAAGHMIQSLESRLKKIDGRMSSAGTDDKKQLVAERELIKKFMGGSKTNYGPDGLM
jgi:hypothetical protein